MPLIRALRRTLPIAAMTPDERRAYDAQRKADSRARLKANPLYQTKQGARRARERERKDQALLAFLERLLASGACEDATLTPSSNPHTPKPLKGNDL